MNKNNSFFEAFTNDLHASSQFDLDMDSITDDYILANNLTVGPAGEMTVFIHSTIDEFQSENATNAITRKWHEAAEINDKIKKTILVINEDLTEDQKELLPSKVDSCLFGEKGIEDYFQEIAE